MSLTHLHIKGARTHNLKNIDLRIPRDQLVVLTGLSGSGKSSLAFDTIYAEGQRRYVESLSAYARQFLDQMEKPEVDFIEGLSPAISIEQKTTSKNPRSTVATVTEIYDYFRLLFARVGEPNCPQCHQAIVQQSASDIIQTIINLPEGRPVLLLAPVVRDRKGEYRKRFAELAALGYTRARVDGEMILLEDPPVLDKQLKHTIEVVVDRLKIRPDQRERVADSVEHALKLSEGLILLHFPGKEEPDRLLSEHLVCHDCGISFPQMQPRNFSFNSPHGACPECDGLGESRTFDPHRCFHPRKSLRQGAILPFTGKDSSWTMTQVKHLARHYGFSMDTPWQDLPQRARELVTQGSDEKIHFIFEKETRRFEFSDYFEGVLPNLKRRYRETASPQMREKLETFMSLTPCEICHGKRLQPFPLAVTLSGRNIAEITACSVDQALAFFQGLHLEGHRAVVAEKVLKEVLERLVFLKNVGLGYLTLNRSAGTLSGGESQRIRLATQLGSRLMGVLYVLDEPSIGLHQRDNEKLLHTLRGMRDLGNSVLVVEHDEDTIRAADFVVDLGPGAGEHGGQVVCAGTPQEIMDCETSLTGQFLNGQEEIPVPDRRRKAQNNRWLRVKGACHNNLKGIDVRFPVGAFTCVTGVSGSGKSTLVSEILYKAAMNALHDSPMPEGRVESISGLQYFDKVIEIDQSPIGRTPRSNPATYVGVFTPLRELFAQVPDARARGYHPGRFSFNVKGGRCETCEGGGMIKIEMHFLPDVYVQCETCQGQRYNRETLEVRYRGKTIADVLNMTVEEALLFFDAVPAVKKKLQTLHDVGLDYIRLGQSATTLSGGEAQRIKLSKELSRRDTGQTLYILDEPTTGLHFADVKRLIGVLQRLIDANNTMIMIEHNLDVIKCADYLVDLGPEGGDAGGEIIAVGTPEELVRHAESHTGRFLRRLLPHSSS
jgi:excinuclease ABC subunit A